MSRRAYWTPAIALGIAACGTEVIGKIPFEGAGEDERALIWQVSADCRESDLTGIAERRVGMPAFHVLGVEQSADEDGRIKVSVHAQGPQVLALSSQKSVHWTVVSEEGASIRKVILLGPERSSVTVPLDTALNDRSGRDDTPACVEYPPSPDCNTFAMLERAEVLAALSLSSFHGCRSARSFLIQEEQEAPKDAPATWSPRDISFGVQLSLDQLTAELQDSDAPGGVRSDLGHQSGRWYWELDVRAGAHITGFATASLPLGADPSFDDFGGCGYASDGLISCNIGSAELAEPYQSGDVIGVALDLDGGVAQFHKNGAWQGVAREFSTYRHRPVFHVVHRLETHSSIRANFGGREFSFKAPAGFSPRF